MTENKISSSGPTYTSCRYVMTYVGFLGFVCVYAIRFNMSVAIVCMTRDPVNTQNNSNISVLSQNSSDSCSVDEINQESLAKQEGEIEWDRETRGIILSSFFWGYLLTQFPGGILASQFGGKKVFGIGMFFAIVATYFLPVAARFHYGAVFALRFIMGFGTGVVFPAMQGILGRWAPKYERSQLVAMTYSGTMIGNLLIFSTGGLLCEYGFDGGWPSLFYVTAIVSTMWLVLWYYCVYDSPEEHPRITREELIYIQSSIGIIPKVSLKETPWRSIFTSGAVWGIIIAHISSNLSGYTIMTLLPSYLKDVMKFNIKQNGLYASLPYIGMFLGGISAGYLADWIRRRGVRTVLVRKWFSAICYTTSAVLMVSVGYISCGHRGLAVGLIVFASTMLSIGGRGGYSCNHIDIAPKYANILLGISNTAATIPGILSPLLAGWIVKNGLRTEWQIMFYICAAGSMLGVVGVMILFKGEIQDWAKENDNDTDVNMMLNEGHNRENV